MFRTSYGASKKNFCLPRSKPRALLWGPLATAPQARKKEIHEVSVSAIPRVAELAKTEKFSFHFLFFAPRFFLLIGEKIFLFLAAAELARRAETQIVSQGLALPRARRARQMSFQIPLFGFVN